MNEGIDGMYGDMIRDACMVRGENPLFAESEGQVVSK